MQTNNRDIRAYILSNVTMEPVVPHLRAMQAVCAPYDAIMLELCSNKPAASGADIVICWMEGLALVGMPGDGANLRERLYLSLLEEYTSAHPGQIVLANTLCFPALGTASFADEGPVSQRQRERAFNDALQAMRQRLPNLLVVDTALLFRLHGESSLYSFASWYAARAPYSRKFYVCLAALWDQALRAYRHRAKKVLVVDLDNTLWGGVVGELGSNGVLLSEEGVGRAFRDFQRQIAELKDQGVLLAIVSKNNEEDVWPVFADNGMMILRREDFVEWRINWRPKSQNLLEIAEALGLGLDTFVFVDDNPAEQAEVRHSLPPVCVPEFPAKPHQIPQWFLSEVVYPHFPKLSLTDEDRCRSVQYEARKNRELVASSMSPASFIAMLDIKLAFHRNQPSTLDRVSQLSQRTTQFNLTGRRYSHAQLAAQIASNSLTVVCVEYEDRFGKEGIVGAAVLDRDERRIESFYLSCRVIGRSVEMGLLEACESEMERLGMQHLHASYVPSARNSVCMSMFEQHGYEVVSVEEGGVKHYRKRVGDGPREVSRGLDDLELT